MTLTTSAAHMCERNGKTLGLGAQVLAAPAGMSRASRVRSTSRYEQAQAILVRSLVLVVGLVTTCGCSTWNPGTPYNPTMAGTPSRDHASGSGAYEVVRGQGEFPHQTRYGDNSLSPGSDEHYRYPMDVSERNPTASAEVGRPRTNISPEARPVQYNESLPPPGNDAWAEYSRPQGSVPGVSNPPQGVIPPPSGPRGGTANGAPGAYPPGSYGEFDAPGLPGTAGGPGGEYGPNVYGPTPTTGPIGLPNRLADVIVNVQETQTGRIMLGAGINSDAGVTGQLVIDERNFDWRRWPGSVDDVLNGKAFRGRGQGFRLEAMPGRIVERYMLQFTEPYLLGTRWSMSLSGYMFDRRYFDWDENRLGGRLSLGYRLLPDLSLSVGVRAEEVDLSNPRVTTIPDLNAALDETHLYSGRISLTHDTRNNPFAPSEGHMLELSYTQAFGDFDYPRGEIDYRRHLLITERPDSSGRHVFSYSMRLGFSGEETPIYENFFAGGYSTIRGFDFRGASPRIGDVAVGGEFLMLGSFEYMFPITADDMLKGVVFCDYGTVEEKIEIDTEDFRVALGAGLRISIPAMGPAPIALDFAVPVAREDSDLIENFSFFVGLGR